MSKTKDNSETKVIEVENMDEILGTAASVAISGGDAKPTFFSKNESDTTFLDKPIDEPIDKVETPEEIEAKRLADAKKTPEELEAEKNKAMDSQRGVYF